MTPSFRARQIAGYQLVIGHDVVWIVEKTLGTIRETDCEQVSVRALATASFRVNDEVFDLQETVQAKIPVGDLLRVQAIRRGPLRHLAHSAASSSRSTFGAQSTLPRSWCTLRTACGPAPRATSDPPWEARSQPLRRPSVLGADPSNGSWNLSTRVS